MELNEAPSLPAEESRRTPPPAGTPPIQDRSTPAPSPVGTPPIQTRGGLLEYSVSSPGYSSGDGTSPPLPRFPGQSPLPGGLPPLPLDTVQALGAVDFSSMPVPVDAWLAVHQLEAALEGVRHGVETQLSTIESDTHRLETMYRDLRGQVDDVDAEGECRSLLVCYFPREANKEMIRTAFAAYGSIDSVYLVHKDGKPACYGFVNFHEHEAAANALQAANEEKIELIDKRNVVWHVKAEWTLTSEIPKKPKKKRTKKANETPGKLSDDGSSPTPPVALNKAMMKGYHPSKMTGLPSHARIPRTLSYTVPTAPQA